VPTIVPNGPGVYNLRRQYTTSTGRFTAVDPLTPTVGDPAVAGYAADQATRLTDPTGEFPLTLRPQPRRRLRRRQRSRSRSRGDQARTGKRQDLAHTRPVRRRRRGQAKLALNKDTRRLLRGSLRPRPGPIEPVAPAYGQLGEGIEITTEFRIDITGQPLSLSGR
jgi:hypothetical protein